ncbi:hypothetical protein HYT92_03670, partial [Candidatus Pacearchaeota archaeon]|nr:hypothetical protein [Candidatus Pacearchaeota archaeon]
MTNDAVDKVNELLKVSFFSKKLKDKFVELAGLLENRRYDDALNLIEQDEENGKVFLELGTPGLERLKRGIRELKGEGVADWPREKGPLTITLDVWPAKAKFYPGVIVGTNVQLEYEIKGRPPFHSYGYCYENDIWKKISELKRKLDLNWGNLDFDIGRKITGPGKYNFNMVAADSKKVREGSASIPFYLYEIKVEITEAAGLPVLKDAGPCGAPDYTAPYDCDSNGVISKPSCISTTADVAIDFLPFNNSLNYSNAGVQIVQIAEGYQGVEFDWDFSASEKLDFCKIDIKTSSPTNNFGYVLFNSTQNVSNKTIYVDKLSSSSNAVCIKDILGVVSVSEFSSNCSASNEVLLRCPSPANSTYNCQIIENGTTFQVWPLSHSAVREIKILGLVSGGT